NGGAAPPCGPVAGRSPPLARWGVMRTRSTSLALVLYVPMVGLPLLGCAKPARHEPEPQPPPEIVAALSLDRRPEAKQASVGEDITEAVRAQNAPGKEPPLPSRHGYAGRLAQ